MPYAVMQTREHRRLQEAEKLPWRFWGPYLSERQWGTVREDYSDNGDAWNYFTHDQARSRAYHGARTAWPASVTGTGFSASRWPCGTARIPSSRNACSAWPTARVITARTSRSITSISTARRPTPT